MRLKIHRTITKTTYEDLETPVFEWVTIPCWVTGTNTCQKCKYRIGEAEHFPLPPDDTEFISVRTREGVYEYHIKCWEALVKESEE